VLLVAWQEEYNILNMAFYVFLNSGLSLWAFGLRINEGSDLLTSSTPFTDGKLLPTTDGTSAPSSPNLGDVMDYFLLGAAPLTLLLYYLGASEFHTKVPIYIMMSAIFAVLTSRFWQVRQNEHLQWNYTGGGVVGLACSGLCTIMCLKCVDADNCGYSIKTHVGGEATTDSWQSNDMSVGHGHGINFAAAVLYIPGVENTQGAPVSGLLCRSKLRIHRPIGKVSDGCVPQSFVPVSDDDADLDSIVHTSLQLAQYQAAMYVCMCINATSR
jgi:hypothetical protein